MWTKIKPYMPWNLIEFACYLIFFTFLDEQFFHDGQLGVATMLAACALFIAIQTRRKLDRGEYK